MTMPFSFTHGYYTDVKDIYQVGTVYFNHVVRYDECIRFCALVLDNIYCQSFYNITWRR